MHFDTLSGTLCVRQPAPLDTTPRAAFVTQPWWAATVFCPTARCVRPLLSGCSGVLSPRLITPTTFADFLSESGKPTRRLDIGEGKATVKQNKNKTATCSHSRSIHPRPPTRTGAVLQSTHMQCYRDSFFLSGVKVPCIACSMGRFFEVASISCSNFLQYQKASAVSVCDAPPDGSISTTNACHQAAKRDWRLLFSDPKKYPILNMHMGSVSREDPPLISIAKH
jgi:hypothetical protein